MLISTSATASFNPNTTNSIRSLTSKPRSSPVTATEPSVAAASNDSTQHTVEIKRMFVRPENRGSGAAKQLLDELEKWAIEFGCSRAVLETGMKNPEAIRFYTKSGYATIENYGQYVGMETSICMAKTFRETS